MNVREIMSKDPVCCTPETSVVDAAKLMVENDCGQIPVVQDQQSRRLVGVVTDRDICCRVVARNLSPASIKVRDCMSSPVATVKPDMQVTECFRVMDQNIVRRVPVVDDRGACCGIVSQADLVEKAPKDYAQQVARNAGQQRGWSSSSSLAH
jgi:CBS domain-containing protein